MHKYGIVLLLCMLFISCGESDVYQTKSGMFASKQGKFVADFPTKPNYQKIENQIGLQKFDLHLYRSSLGNFKIYSIEYSDFEPSYQKSMTLSELYQEALSNYSKNIGDEFVLDFQEEITQNGLDGLYFVFFPKDENIKGLISGKFFKKGKRFYTQTFFGYTDNNSKKFLDSFKLL